MTVDEKMLLRRAFKRVMERIEQLEEDLAKTQEYLAAHIEGKDIKK